MTPRIKAYQIHVEPDCSGTEWMWSCNCGRMSHKITDMEGARYNATEHVTHNKSHCGLDDISVHTINWEPPKESKRYRRHRDQRIMTYTWTCTCGGHGVRKVSHWRALRSIAAHVKERPECDGRQTITKHQNPIWRRG